MKNKTKIMVTLMALGVSSLVVGAQDNNDGPPGGPEGQGGPRGHHRPPPLPIVMALDVNHDGVIDSNEIANASAELLTLDRNGDGRLTPDEYLPPLPKDAPADAPRPPTPLIIKALDVNGDGVIDSNEIANASAELMTLDKNNDGQLTRNEYLGPRPPHRMDQNGPNDWNNAGSQDNGRPSGPPSGDGDGNNPPSGSPPDN